MIFLPILLLYYSQSVNRLLLYLCFMHKKDSCQSTALSRLYYFKLYVLGISHLVHSHIKSSYVFLLIFYDNTLNLLQLQNL